MATLIVWGTADRVIPRHPRPAGRRLAAGGLVQLSGCGQVAQVECPDGVADAPSGFLWALR
jgi:pimeloyl-ACP methyl ester carboxylesterase